MPENPFLYNEPRGESGRRHDRQLQPAGQHPAVPVGVQPDHRPVLAAAQHREAVGGVVVDDRADRVPRRSASHPDHQRARHARGVANVKQRAGSRGTGSAPVGGRWRGGPERARTPAVVRPRRHGDLVEERRHERDVADRLLLRDLHDAAGHPRLRPRQRFPGSAAPGSPGRMRGRHGDDSGGGGGGARRRFGDGRVASLRGVHHRSQRRQRDLPVALRLQLFFLRRHRQQVPRVASSSLLSVGRRRCSRHRERDCTRCAQLSGTVARRRRSTSNSARSTITSGIQHWRRSLPPTFLK